MTATRVELGDGEQLMSSESELVFRQVTQHMFDGDRIATTAFGPSTADRDMPSYSRSTVVTAQDSRDWHTQNAKSPSLGVWGITVGEVIDSGRYVVDDSRCSLDDGQKRSPGHCFVDFRELSKPQKKEVRAQLYFHAIARGELPTMATTPDGQLFA